MQYTVTAGRGRAAAGDCGQEHAAVKLVIRTSHFGMACAEPYPSFLIPTSLLYAKPSSFVVDGSLLEMCFLF